MYEVKIDPDTGTEVALDDAPRKQRLRTTPEQGKRLLLLVPINFVYRRSWCNGIYTCRTVVLTRVQLSGTTLSHYAYKCL